MCPDRFIPTKVRSFPCREKKMMQWTESMWKLYMSIKEGMGEKESYHTKFDHHEKDIGSTMSNQLEGEAKSEMCCGGRQNASKIKTKMASK